MIIRPMHSGSRIRFFDNLALENTDTTKVGHGQVAMKIEPIQLLSRTFVRALSRLTETTVVNLLYIYKFE